MIGAISSVVSVSNLCGIVSIVCYYAFSRTMPVTFMSPHVPWDDKLHDGDTVARWAAAALTVPYTEEVECSVVNALLQIVSIDSLRPHLPTDLWTWLNIRKMALDFFF